MSNSHLIHAIENHPDQPSIFFFCCTHGNEVAGLKAIDQLFENLYELTDYIKANIYGILGNEKAYQLNMRYLDRDLNRIWTKENLLQVDQKMENDHEFSELKSLYELIEEKAKDKNGELYFIDLHTTSSKSKPFIVMNDSLKNIKFASSLGISVIIGVERFINGSMLDFFNERGYVSFAFEGGSHDDRDAIYAIENFCIKILLQTESLAQHGIHVMEKKTKLQPSTFYEMKYRHRLENKDEFYMLEGYKNFQPIKKGENLAVHNHKTIKSPGDFTIFMPLYQEQGEDGFFFIKSISNFKLKLISVLRKSKFQKLLLPHQNVTSKDQNTIIVNKLKTKPFHLQLLHLLGFRKRRNINGKKAEYRRNERYPQPVKDWLN